MERRKVIKIGVEGLRKFEWFELHELEGREPAVFTVLIESDGSYTKCGPYCAISYMYPRYKGPRRRAQQVESCFFFGMVPRIRAALNDRDDAAETG